MLTKSIEKILMVKFLHRNWRREITNILNSLIAECAAA